MRLSKVSSLSATYMYMYPRNTQKLIQSDLCCVYVHCIICVHVRLFQMPLVLWRGRLARNTSDTCQPSVWSSEWYGNIVHIYAFANVQLLLIIDA